jgi:hypothetical protein
MRTTVLCILLIVAVQLLFSCASDELSGSFGTNQPPEVWLSIAPPERSTVAYRAHVFWGGWDPDGEVAHFEYAVTNNDGGYFDPADTTGSDKWHRIDVKDSVFTFSADVPLDSTYSDLTEQGPLEFLRSHTFFIRAVDELGARSEADYRSFTARNLSPIVTITDPPHGGLSPSRVPALITFRWLARDYVANVDEIVPPDSVRSILVNVGEFSFDWDLATDYIREHPHAPEWTPWHDYEAPGDSGLFWTPEEHLAFGYYLFAVQVKDEAGAINPVFDIEDNMRRIDVSPRTSGPVLVVMNRFMQTIRTSTTRTSPVSIDLPSGIPMQFTWHADASSYGGTVTGYRYGWDIQDINVDSQWEVDWTPFVGSTAASKSRTFYFGTHTLFVEVRDNSDFRSRAVIVVNIVPFTMERDLLLVDDFGEGNSPGFLLTKGQIPSDTEHDAFWEDVLQNVDHDVYPLYGQIKPMPLSTLAHYKTIIWNAWGTPLYNTGAVLTDFIMWQSLYLNLLEPFLQSGGKLLICGEHPMAIAIDHAKFPAGRFGSRKLGPAYPFIFRYELEGTQYGDLSGPGVGEDSFAYKDCCLNVLDISYGVNTSYQAHRDCRLGNQDLRSYNPTTEGIREALPLNKAFGFPLLELRPEVTRPGYYYSEESVGLPADIYNPPYFNRFCSKAQIFPRRSCFKPIYGLGCLDTDSRVYNAPIAFWTSTWADVPNPYGVTGRSAVWGFAPVFFKPDQVREALELIMFNEWKLTPLSNYTSPVGDASATEPGQ